MSLSLSNCPGRRRALLKKGSEKRIRAKLATPLRPLVENQPYPARDATGNYRMTYPVALGWGDWKDNWKNVVSEVDADVNSDYLEAEEDNYWYLANVIAPAEEAAFLEKEKEREAREAQEAECAREHERELRQAREEKEREKLYEHANEICQIFRDMRESGQALDATEKLPFVLQVIVEQLKLSSPVLGIVEWFKPYTVGGGLDDWDDCFFSTSSLYRKQHYVVVPKPFFMRYNYYVRSLPYGSNERKAAEKIFSKLACGVFPEWDCSCDSHFMMGYMQYYNGDMDYGEGHCRKELCGCDDLWCRGKSSECGHNHICDIGIDDDNCMRNFRLVRSFGGASKLYVDTSDWQSYRDNDRFYKDAKEAPYTWTMDVIRELYAKLPESNPQPVTYSMEDMQDKDKEKVAARWVRVNRRPESKPVKQAFIPTTVSNFYSVLETKD
jgi:hypothetical protein